MGKTYKSTFKKGRAKYTFKKGRDKSTFKKGRDKSTFKKGRDKSTFKKGRDKSTFKKGKVKVRKSQKNVLKTKHTFLSVDVKKNDIFLPNYNKIKQNKITMNPSNLNLGGNGEKRYNEQFIDLMEKLSNIMLKQGEPFRARAYQKAQETLMAYPDDINNVEQLKEKPGIGSTILEKLNEYVNTGTLKILEREKNNPINILGEIYGVGPKKAKELVEKGITTIEQLRERQDEVLNDIQKVGLKYYEDILKRIPRSEIEEYKIIFEKNFEKVSQFGSDSHMEIVGSYRRGAESSGDIDVIITSNNSKVFVGFIDELIKDNI